MAQLKSYFPNSTLFQKQQKYVFANEIDQNLKATET